MRKFTNTDSRKAPPEFRNGKTSLKSLTPLLTPINNAYLIHKEEKSHPDVSPANSWQVRCNDISITFFSLINAEIETDGKYNS